MKEKIEELRKEYSWENGECDVCGYDCVYNEGECHSCKEYNNAIDDVLKLYE